MSKSLANVPTPETKIPLWKVDNPANVDKPETVRFLVLTSVPIDEPPFRRIPLTVRSPAMSTLEPKEPIPVIVPTPVTSKSFVVV